MPDNFTHQWGGGGGGGKRLRSQWVNNFSIHSKAKSSLRTVPINSKVPVYLHSLLTMWEKHILASVNEIQKENWG